MNYRKTIIVLWLEGALISLYTFLLSAIASFGGFDDDATKLVIFAVSIFILLAVTTFFLLKKHFWTFYLVAIEQLFFTFIFSWDAVTNSVSIFRPVPIFLLLLSLFNLVILFLNFSPIKKHNFFNT